MGGVCRRAACGSCRWRCRLVLFPVVRLFGLVCFFYVFVVWCWSVFVPLWTVPLFPSTTVPFCSFRCGGQNGGRNNKANRSNDKRGRKHTSVKEEDGGAGRRRELDDCLFRSLSGASPSHCTVRCRFGLGPFLPWRTSQLTFAPTRQGRKQQTTTHKKYKRNKDGRISRTIIFYFFFNARRSVVRRSVSESVRTFMW